MSRQSCKKLEKTWTRIVVVVNGLNISDQLWLQKPQPCSTRDSHRVVQGRHRGRLSTTTAASSCVASTVPLPSHLAALTTHLSSPWSGTTASCWVGSCSQGPTQSLSLPPGSQSDCHPDCQPTDNDVVKYHDNDRLLRTFVVIQDESDCIDKQLVATFDGLNAITTHDRQAIWLSKPLRTHSLPYTNAAIRRVVYRALLVQWKRLQSMRPSRHCDRIIAVRGNDRKSLGSFRWRCIDGVIWYGRFSHSIVNGAIAGGFIRDNVVGS